MIKKFWTFLGNVGTCIETITIEGGGLQEIKKTQFIPWGQPVFIASVIAVIIYFML